ncbi:Uncharacterised protein [Bacteroides xylanisolvens]|nr:Uncharacterised protein [Bacteroides xylanisolvens]
MEASDAVLSGVSDAWRQRGVLMGELIFYERFQLILVGEKGIDVGRLPSDILAIEIQDACKNEKGDRVGDIKNVVAMVNSRKRAIHGIVLHPLFLQIFKRAIVGHLAKIIVDLISQTDLIL